MTRLKLLRGLICSVLQQQLMTCFLMVLPPIFNQQMFNEKTAITYNDHATAPSPKRHALLNICHK
jgi:hypothetical protein